MGRFICLHYPSKDNNKIWIKADAITAVIDERPMHGWTRIGTYADPEGYCVNETAESVIGLIEQKTNPLDNYVCPVPVNLAKSRTEGGRREMSRTNILTVHCNHPIDVYYWLAGKIKLGREYRGGRYCYTDENWEELKDGNQVISISWDQSYDEYLVVFRVEGEE